MLTIPDLKCDFHRDIDDFTFYVTSEDWDRSTKRLAAEKQWDDTVELTDRSTGTMVRGRLNACRCYASRFVSCSFRRISDIAGDNVAYHMPYDITRSGFNPKAPNGKVDEKPEHTAKTVSLQFMCSIEQLCDAIFRRIFAPMEQPRGLIVISGATAAGKSQTARGLVYKYLCTKIEAENSGVRRPHLVTCEDPVDKLWAKNPDEARMTGVDYTPRDLGLDKDVNSLENAVTTALRQTPAVFFVGEVRSRTDWRSILRFASTGHLAITTSHAGSLTEAMGQILRATQSNTPALRSETASRVLALVHLRTARIAVTIDDLPVELVVTLPAIWVRSAASTKAIMADGLSALLPFRDVGGVDAAVGAGQFGSLGRTSFAEQLLKGSNQGTKSSAGEQILRTARTWDLEGI
jgi:hypothetical protein